MARHHIDPPRRRLARQIAGKRKPPVAVVVPCGRQYDGERGAIWLGQHGACGGEVKRHEGPCRIERPVKQQTGLKQALHRLRPRGARGVRGGG